MDLKTISTVVGIVAAIGSSAGTYAVTQYRLQAAEVKIAALEGQTDELAAALEAAGDRVTCLICDAHEIACPGC